MNSQPIQTRDNSERTLTEDELCHLPTLKKLAEPTIANLCLEEHPNLLIFPQDINVYGDNIGNSHIFDVKGEKMMTGNIMGFIGCGNTKVSISSRFAQEKNDYFLHYMLRKVLAINLFDLQFNSDEESIFDFLIYLFPTFLKRAMQQGLYREYQTRKYNDANVKGRIDISRHIRQNIPFAGKIAYTSREYAQDNHLTQLIRHTIDYISHHKYSGNILHNDDDTSDAVKAICQATESYNRNERQSVINQNLRPISHPYYSEYRRLQQLCLQILRQEEMKYGRDNDEIYGVLFDGAWLWENYMNTIMPKLGFIHADNNLRKNGITLFKGGGSTRFPDFYKDDFVIDAKYKRLSGKSVLEVDRDDIHQVITYMYRLKAQYGGFAVPWNSLDKWSERRELLGYGGWMNVYGVIVDHQVTNFKEYVALMEKNEIDFQRQIECDYKNIKYKDSFMS